MEKRRKQRADRLEKNAALNYATATELIGNGADDVYVQPLRDQAAKWEAEAAKLRIPKVPRKRAIA